MVAVSFFGLLIAALVIALFAGLLASERTRVFGLMILALLVVGGLFASVRVSRRPSHPTLVDGATQLVQGEEIYVTGALAEHQQLVAEARAQAEAARAQAAAEVLKNQRLAARLPEAVLHISPDGTRLETYPDGMQIREDHTSRERTLVREADLNSAQHLFYTPYWSSSYSSRSSFALWLFAAPFALLALAFVAMKAKKGALGGWPAALAVLGCLPLLLFFGTMSQTRREVRSGSDAAVGEVPLSISGDSVTIRRSPKFVEDGRGVRIPIPQPAAGQGAGDKEFARVFAHELGDDGGPQGLAFDPSSIESLWDKLTKPRIQLDPPKPVKISPTKAEVAQAAKIILAASAPVSDPFTQGWLVNAAKAIASAAAKEPTDADVSDAVTAKQTPEGSRPAWIDSPPKSADGTPRIVVSTDVLTSSKECRDQLEKRLRYKVAERLRDLAKQATGQPKVQSPMLADMGISPDFILHELCSEEAYVETVSSSNGEMKRAHVLIEFTPEKDQMLLHRWQSAMRALGARPAEVGLTAAGAVPSVTPRSIDERPEWVDAPPQQVGNTARVAVSSDPYTTAEECRVQLRQEVDAIVVARMKELVRQNTGAEESTELRLEWLGITPDYIAAELCPQGEYVETISTSVGEMKRVHTLVEFTPPQDQLLLDRWLYYARFQNLELVAGLSSLVVAGLALVYGLLKVDTWTRGYYTKRLFLGVPTAIIAVFFLSAMFGW